MHNNRMIKNHRLKQSNREALVTIGVYAIYFAWWYFFGYGMGNENPEVYTYVFGLPAWFFFSCILGYPLITVVLWVVIRMFFKEVPLDVDNTEAPRQEDGNT